MTLKEFIKTSISDITYAIKECQEEMNSGAIICPTNVGNGDVIKSKDGDLSVSNIEFDVSVTTEVIEQNDNGAEFTLNVVSVFNLGVGSKVTDKGKEFSASRIKFTIPIVFPPYYVELRESNTHRTVKSLCR